MAFVKPLTAGDRRKKAREGDVEPLTEVLRKVGARKGEQRVG